MIKSLLNINLQSACRICLAEQDAKGEMHQIFMDESGVRKEKIGIPLYLKIMSCAAIQVATDDKLPQQICVRCLKRLNEMCEFRELIEYSDAKLRQFIKVKGTSRYSVKEKPLHNAAPKVTEDQDEIASIDIKELPDPRSPNVSDRHEESDDTPNEDERTDRTSRCPRGKSNPQHRADLYTCEVCSKPYKTLNSLRTHKKTHGQKDLKCPECGKVFAYRRLLLQHKLVHREDRDFLCSECGKSFKTKGQLNVHARRHFNDRPFQCKYCDKKFFQISHRNQHLRLHTDERPFSCHICDKSFRNQTGLKGHLYKHAGVQPFQCAVCGKKFSLKSSLKNHIQLHSGEKPFECEHCQKKFALSSSLKIHLKLHSDNNAHICSVCAKKFTDAIHLEEHFRTHGDRRDFICPTCGKGFKQSVGLTTHMKTHNPDRPYQCDLCDKSFVMRQTFEVHYRRHSGVKPYKCSICNKCFRQSSTLKTHMIIHTGIKPFACECGRSFTQRSVHEKHVKTCDHVKKSNELECDLQFESMKASTPQQTSTHPLPGVIIQMVNQAESFTPIHYQAL